MASLPRPSPTGVRIAGDMFQWMLAWQACVSVIRDAAAGKPNPAVAVGVEADGAGNLDDLVLYRAAPPHTYAQVKYAVDASTPVNSDYLLTPSASGGPSILSKMARTWQQLISAGDPVDLALISNRLLDPGDPLLSQRDSRTQLLMPRAGQGGPGSALGIARRQWAAAAELSEARLRGLLEVLRFDLARDPTHVYDHLQTQMLAAGLRPDEAAIHAGADWVARQVRDGHRKLSLQMIPQAIESLALRAGTARAVISVATLKPDPEAAEADYAIDWVTRFEGASAYLKRRPQPPATWGQLQQEIEAIPHRLPPGTTAIAVTGSLRLAPAFAIGAALRMVTGADLAVLQRGQLWASTEPYETGLPPASNEHQVSQGNDLAIAIAVATDPTTEVLRFLHEQHLPVDRLLVLSPSAGARDNSVPDASAANALAISIRDAVRRASQTAPRIHLFQAGPMGLALLLGHRWNRLRPTTVYEDVTGNPVYEPAFTLDA
jgi:SMODS-associated and fused to various effectors sensor domain